MGNRQLRHVLATTGGLLLLGGMVAGPASAAAELGHEVTLEDGGYAALRVTGGAELAGEQMSVLVLDEDAALDAPAAADIVYLDQRVVSEDGSVSLRVALPTGELDGYWLAVNTTGGTERYVAPLDGEAEEQPTGEPEPTEDPTDGTTDGPTDDATDGASDGPTDEPTDGADHGSADGGSGDGGGGSPDGGAGAGDGSGAGSDSAGRGSLSRTGAPVALVAGVALAAALAGGLTLRLRRRA